MVIDFKTSPSALDLGKPGSFRGVKGTESDLGPGIQPQSPSQILDIQE
jgi:hypothetical protein